MSDVNRFSFSYKVLFLSIKLLILSINGTNSIDKFLFDNFKLSSLILIFLSSLFSSFNGIKPRSTLFRTTLTTKKTTTNVARTNKISRKVNILSVSSVEAA